MNATIITIGDEILIGQVVDSNSAWIARELNLIGINISRIISISDTKSEIFNALDQESKSSDIILMTGGLGPTKDDITKHVLAEYFNSKLIVNQKVLKHIEEWLSHRGVVISESNRKQAEVPESCEVLPNPLGTAPGMLFRKGRTIIISMPGVPFEMKAIMKSEVIPVIRNMNPDTQIIHKTLLTQGIPESHLAEKIKDIEDKLPPYIKLAYLPSPAMVRLRITGKANRGYPLPAEMELIFQQLKDRVKEYSFGEENEKMQEIVGKLLLHQKKTLAIAESCTGGYISGLITSVPGCSAYFKGGVVAYSNEIKNSILSVHNSLLDRYGAVSKEVVEEMAKGVLFHLSSDFGLATSGIAGPSGGSEEKPVGTTWIAVCSKNIVHSESFNFGNQRERNIIRASHTALNMLRKLIIKSE